MSQVAVQTPTDQRRFRWWAVAGAVASVVAVAVIGVTIASWVIRSNRDPFESAPELGQRVWEYTVLPLIGTTSQVDNVEVVTMAVTRMEDGLWGVHLVLRSEDNLPRYALRVTEADDPSTMATCAASGASGWGECYVALSGPRGSTVEMDLWINREVVGRFPIHLEPWGSGG
jgi:hypothetical protein